MSSLVYYILSGVLILGVLAGIFLMSKVKTAVLGNALSAVCMLGAIIITLLYNDIISTWVVYPAIAVGAIIGVIWAKKIKMIQMPETVAILNGIGGAASLIVGALTMFSPANAFDKTTAALAVVVGVITLVGSLIAAGKLAKIINQRPVRFKGHSIMTGASLGVSLISVILFAALPIDIAIAAGVFLPLAIISGGAFGFLFSMRVGGADMPITISLLNSLSGVAAAIAGMAIGDVLLVAVGGVVGASGLLLTQIMCKSMNRSLLDILLGKTSMPKGGLVTATAAAGTAESTESTTSSDNAENAVSTETADNDGESDVSTSDTAEPEPEPVDAAQIVKDAKKVIIVPGYGMALAQAQNLVKELSDIIESRGAELKFAIHPVAGRMPGHMNVLLCEADLPYEKLYEMDDVNDDFKNADVCIVIGANDVINPAARTSVGTPIYGMPVLNADQAKHVLVFNYDLKPGYAGVDNPVYKMKNVTLFLGNAQETLAEFIEKVK